MRRRWITGAGGSTWRPAMSRRCSTRRSCGRGGSTSRARRRRSSPERCSCSRCCSRAGAPTPFRGRDAVDRWSDADMVTCDALIVGGGPAGSTCAWQLRRAGLDVMVVDAATFPRDKVCAGWITPQVVTALRFDTEAYAGRRTCQPITGFRVGLIGGRGETAVAYDRPISFGIRRCEFDHYLLQRADARLALGAPITSIRREREQWIVNDEIRAPMLIGAGGSGCPVARMLNGVWPGGPLVVAREAEARIEAAGGDSLGIDRGVPELFFCRDLQG